MRRMPTFDTTMSTEPKASAAACTSAATSSCFETSAITPIARPPASAISFTIASTAARSLWPLTTTRAPCAASASAIALPILRPEPVTMAVRFIIRP